mmetsp:Transcript_84621/g.261897  ORF Transcript_84621/g.261897 Transcript_84621/m.261897 type:complete len:464 (-) Transcript_84621:266-1657(-)
MPVEDVWAQRHAQEAPQTGAEDEEAEGPGVVEPPDAVDSVLPQEGNPGGHKAAEADGHGRPEPHTVLYGDEEVIHNARGPSPARGRGAARVALEGGKAVDLDLAQSELGPVGLGMVPPGDTDLRDAAAEHACALPGGAQVVAGQGEALDTDDALGESVNPEERRRARSVLLDEAHLDARLRDAQCFAKAAGVQVVAGQAHALQAHDMACVAMGALHLELRPQLFAAALGQTHLEAVVLRVRGCVEELALAAQALERHGNRQGLGRLGFEGPASHLLCEHLARVAKAAVQLAGAVTALRFLLVGLTEAEHPRRRQEKHNPDGKQHHGLDDEGAPWAPKTGHSRSYAAANPSRSPCKSKPSRPRVLGRVPLYPHCGPDAHQRLCHAHAQLRRQHVDLRQCRHRLLLQPSKDEATGRLPEEPDDQKNLGVASHEHLPPHEGGGYLAELVHCPQQSKQEGSPTIPRK